MKLLKIILIFISLGVIVAYFRSDKYPQANDIDKAILVEPTQSPTSKKAFQVTEGGETYTVNPKFEYFLGGLVVSQHHSDSFVDLYHEKTRDMFNIKDVCLIWGQNLATNRFHNIKFKNGDFSCNYRTFNDEAFRNFDNTKFSNNHLVTNDETVRKQLKQISVGDQIQIKGYLVDYERADGYKRNSSTTRTDTGNGACEVIFVEEVKIIKDFSRLGNILLRI